VFFRRMVFPVDVYQCLANGLALVSGAIKTWKSEVYVTQERHCSGAVEIFVVNEVHRMLIRVAERHD
jgi:hypothetical protein